MFNIDRTEVSYSLITRPQMHHKITNTCTQKLFVLAMVYNADTISWDRWCQTHGIIPDWYIRDTIETKMKSRKTIQGKKQGWSKWSFSAYQLKGVLKLTHCYLFTDYFVHYYILSFLNILFDKYHLEHNGKANGW